MSRKRVKKVLRKTSKSRSSKEQINASTLRKMIRSVRWTESYTSLLMGVIVVVVAVLFVVSLLKQAHHVQDTSSTSTVATPSPTVTSIPSELKPAKQIYTIQKGDDLWHIAEKFYKSGYNWVDIAQANNLSDPGMVFSGNVLVIPNVAAKPTTISSTPEVGLSTIKGDTYTVQSGDDLWHIAVRAYADGYQWTKIAAANNLSNPDLIFSGNVLKLPR